MKCLAVCRREEKVTPTPHFFPRASIFTACYGCWLSPNIFTLAVSSSERALPTVEPKEWDLGSNSIKQKRNWFPHAIACIYRKLSHRSPKVWGRLTAANRGFIFLLLLLFSNIQRFQRASSKLNVWGYLNAWLKIRLVLCSAEGAAAFPASFEDGDIWNCSAALNSIFRCLNIDSK